MEVPFSSQDQTKTYSPWLKWLLEGSVTSRSAMQLPMAAFANCGSGLAKQWTYQEARPRIGVAMTIGPMMRSMPWFQQKECLSLPFGSSYNPTKLD